MAKMSSSRGGVPTAADALKVLEAPILRWLYVRRQPKQAFNVDFGAEVVRLYDEWDSLGRKAADPARRDAQVLAFERASATAAAGTLPTPPVVVPFRVLSSVADVTAGSAEQIGRIVEHVGHAHDSVADLEPRLGKAMTWTAEFVPAEDRTTVREQPGRRAARRPRRGRGAVAGPAARPAARRAGPRRGHLAGLRRAEADPRASASTTPRPSRSRPTRRSSSACSTGCSSPPTAARACPR